MRLGFSCLSASSVARWTSHVALIPCHLQGQTVYWITTTTLAVQSSEKRRDWDGDPVVREVRSLSRMAPYVGRCRPWGPPSTGRCLLLRFGSRPSRSLRIVGVARRTPSRNRLLAEAAWRSPEVTHADGEVTFVVSVGSSDAAPDPWAVHATAQLFGVG